MDRASKAVLQTRRMTSTMVLGGSGYLGRHIGAAFAQAGHDVVAVSRRPGRVPGARTVTADLARCQVSEIVAQLYAERPQVVVNAAGAVWDVTDRDMVLSNLRLVRRLVAALAQAPWRPHLIHLGSLYEYGPTEPGWPLTEQSVTRPETKYGQIKLLASALVRDAVAAGRIDAAVLRLSNVVGFDMPPSSLPGKVARQLRAAAGRGQTAQVRVTSPRTYRAFVDVRDVADAVLAVADKRITELVNVGGAECVAVSRLIELLIEVSGVPTEIRVVEPAAAEEQRGPASGEQPLDLSTARAVLAWSPHHELIESLKTVWEETA
jgi:nucleoside-diphosphate-sugar epimerase